MASKTTVGIVQMCATADVSANVDVTMSLATEAAAAGAKVVLVPEAFAFIGSERERNTHLENIPREDAEEPGPILRRCIETARSANAHLVLGGFPEQAPDSRAFNTCIHLLPDGAIANVYRKIHLFDVDLADGTRMRESRSTAPGDRAVTTETPFGSLGLTVCYDVRFPLLYQTLADVGAVAIAVPSAFFKNSGKAHWHALLRARAIECQCYMLAPAQHGDHGHRGRKSFGHGLVVDPWGDIVAEIEDGDGFALADVDPKRVEDVRAELPSLANRRAFHATGSLAYEPPPLAHSSPANG